MHCIKEYIQYIHKVVLLALAFVEAMWCRYFEYYLNPGGLVVGFDSRRISYLPMLSSTFLCSKFQIILVSPKGYVAPIMGLYSNHIDNFFVPFPLCRHLTFEQRFSPSPSVVLVVCSIIGNHCNIHLSIYSASTQHLLHKFLYSYS